ncbi:MAG: T9SS type B sorting domain-containing protein [Saprospiraceae bacterium]|nr:T9SS type B sorting domain-containing protein [Saprospiraceae bacterium]
MYLTVASDGCQFDDIHLTNFNGFDVSCNGGNDGSILITTLLGIAPFTYQWSNGGTDSVANNLSAGTYQVMVTDSTGCTSNVNVTITEPPLLITSAFVSSNYNGFQISFPGANDGQATVTATGGTTPYTYAWSNGSTTNVANNLVAGTYTVTVTDANGCSDIQMVVLTDPTGYISQVLPLSNYNNFTVSCFNNNDGIAEVNAVGGTLPYTFLWSNGQTDSVATGLGVGLVTVTITDADNTIIIDSLVLIAPPAFNALITLNNPISCNGFTDANITANGSNGGTIYTYLWENNSMINNRNNLGIGNYAVTVTDMNGCSDTTSIWLIEPPVLTVSMTQDSIYNGFGVSCTNASDGNISAIVSGGTATYTYVWNNGQTTASAINVNAGTHNVTVTDANGCIVINSISLNEPTAIAATTIATSDYNGYHVSCNNDNDGTATVTVSGGIPNYTYLWNNGQTTISATNLNSGIATVTITDDNACTLIDTIILTEPTPFVISTVVTSNYNGADISCFGFNDGSVVANALGGTGNYVYQWNTVSTDSFATNLIAGMYHVTVSDANGCTELDSIIINNPPQLSTVLILTNPVCDGSVNAMAMTSGGTGNYNYQWNTASNDTLNTINNLFTGTYTVTILDANNCQIQSSITVTTLDTLTVNIGNDTTLCVDETLTLDATTPDIINYQWQDGSTNATFTVTANGLYHVLITNTQGCTTTDSIVIDYFAPSLSNGLPIDTIICADTDWLMDATVPNGVQYQWQDGSTNPTFRVINAGNYSVTITNSDGCTIDYSTIVSVQNLPENALYLPTDTIMCEGNPITLNATTEFATDYIWQGESAFYAQNLPHDSTFIVTYPGFYNVNIANYCGSFTQFIEVAEEDCGCYPYIPNAFTPNNDGRNDDFQIYANCILQDFEMNIYDRYGGRVFISNNIDDKWDGTTRGQKVHNGVYVWTITFRAENAKGEIESRTMSGDVTVIR